MLIIYENFYSEIICKYILLKYKNTFKEFLQYIELYLQIISL